MVTSEQIQQLIDAYETRPEAVAKELLGLFLLVPRDVIRALAPLLPEAIDTAEGADLMKLLLSEGPMFEILADTGALTDEKAVRLAQKLHEHEAFLDVKLATWLFERNADETRPSDHRTTNRCLTILAAISDGSRILQQVMQLMRESDQRVRSKAAGLSGKGNRNLDWFLSLVEQAEARVLANAIEPLWHSDWRHAREVFSQSLTSANNRVVGNALVGLYHQGDKARAIRDLRRMAANPDAAFRATAAWAIGELRDEDLQGALSTLAGDVDGGVRRNAIRALTRIRKA